jgi:hypothetical protein
LITNHLVRNGRLCKLKMSLFLKRRKKSEVSKNFSVLMHYFFCEHHLTLEVWTVWCEPVASTWRLSRIDRVTFFKPEACHGFFVQYKSLQERKRNLASLAFTAWFFHRLYSLPSPNISSSAAVISAIAFSRRRCVFSL